MRGRENLYSDKPFIIVAWFSTRFIIDVHILEPMMIGEEDTQIFTQRLEEVIKKAFTLYRVSNLA
ncbi:MULTISPECIES: hypothetical protein [unclassified Sulfuricurvum]|uniref:hypothetical protein n=1 Tax=unclassified Sulfuricurvum TaxID=2632390 RepID=UPI0003251689|nr:MULTISPECIES: hypothetical protein [unclassified Sulfuricurvum]